MNLYLWAIRSNGYGIPYTGRGQIGHIVLTGDDPNMPVVLELSGGGQYPGYDCCPSATRSALRYFGLTDPGAVRVEELEQTAPPMGTFISNVPAAARALGMSSSNVQFGTPPGRYVMNPMLRSVVARTPDYDANSQGVYVTFSGRPAAIPVEKPQPLPVATSNPAEEYAVIQDFEWKGARFIIYVDGKGNLIRSKQPVGGAWATKYIGPGFEPLSAVGRTVGDSTGILHLSVFRADTGMENVYSGDGETFGFDGPLVVNSK